MGKADGPPILAARHVVRRYPARGGVRWGREREWAPALDGVSLELWPGEILGLIGRSGSGKSTLARVLLGLETPDEGEVTFDGRPLGSLSDPEQRRLRREVQVVFQDPHASLDPRQSVGGILAEPLAVHRLVPRGERRSRGKVLLGEVGLPSDDAVLDRLPRALSGGERQRVALARALASGPRALILDEPVSALDVSVRGQVLNVLLELRERAGLAMLLIAHDVRLVARLCGRVAVMAGGRVVEEGPTRGVLENPAHTATAELLAAARWLSEPPRAETARSPGEHSADR
jgi:ABC-type glutathione transport system ATPase component